MNCPACNSQLDVIMYENIEIETCRGCGGEWLDHTELKKIVDQRDVYFDPQKRAEVARSIKPTRMTTDEFDRKMTCPKCSGSTKAINYGGDSGIIIDRCLGCKGIWLDSGELEKIQMFVEGVDDILPEDIKKHAASLEIADESNSSAARNARNAVGFSSIIDFVEITDE